MKAIVFAAAATLAMGAGSAYAQGGSSVQDAWDQMNGIHHMPATQWFAGQQNTGLGQQHAAAPSDQGQSSTAGAGLPVPNSTVQ